MSSPNLDRPNRRSVLLLSAALSLGLALPLTAPWAHAEESQAGGTLRIAFFRDNTDLVSLDPFQVYWIEHRVVIRNVAESLTDQDPETGEIIPWLAESWEVSEDGLEYVFRLRQDVTFSDGSPFDAEAVKTAFDSNKAFVAQVPATFGRTYLTGYDHAEIIGPHVIKLILSAPNAGFLQATSTTNLAILAPASYAKTAEERSRGALIGTGPFVLESYTPEVDLRLVRREDYAWPSKSAKNQGKAWLDAVEVQYIPEASVRNGQFVQGELDVLWPREPFSDLDIAFVTSNGGRIVSRALPGPAYNHYPNTSEGRILSDPRVRAALQKAIDRETYAKGVYSADFPAVQGLYDTTTPFFKSQADRLAYDPEGAAALLDEAGWRLAADGWRYKDGARLTVIQLQRDKETPGDVLVQDQLRQVGIDLKIDIVVRGDYPAGLAAGRYDLANTYMSRADPVVLQTFLDPRFTNNSPLAVNAYPAEVRPEVLALFDAGLQADTREKRRDAYGALQDLLIEENLAFPIWERVWQTALAPNVQDFGWSAEGFALLGDVWLARD